MAKDPKNAMKLMMRVWGPAKAQVKRDVAAMQKIVNKEKGGFKIKPWDYRYYAEKLRKQRYDFDMDSVKPYLQLPNVQKAMFWMAGQLYGFEFKPIKNVPVYHKEVTVYEVQKSGKTVGLWYFDPYARKGKRSGAWMNAYRIQNKLEGTPIIPIVSNNSNFIKAQDGGPTLISWDDASTMFHEFGHALHGLSSNVTYPSLAGTNTARDFVEFPSQIHEDWLSTPEVLKFLKNKEGKVLPKKLVKKLKRAASFNEGFATTEYLASALVDMKLHLVSNKKVDPVRFEKKTLKALGMPSQIVMRHRIPHFGHIFSGEGYSAGYYSYIWADVIRHDAFKAFTEAKGPYDKKVAKSFQKNILSVGNTVDPAKAYRNFRGRDPKVGALLEAKGFKKSVKK
jgi:peptidyl-dipeptidase Dcp